MALAQVMNPILESLFTPVVEDKSLDSYEYVRIAADEGESSATVDASSYLNFRVQDKANWYLPSEAKVEVSFKIQTSAGVPYAADQEIALINNGWSIFRDGRFLIDEQEIEQKNDVGMATTMRNLIYYTDDYSRSVASNNFWYPDSGSAGAVDRNISIPAVTGNPITAINTVLANDAYNAGFDKRKRLLNNSTQQTIMLDCKDAFGFLHDAMLPLIGTSITLSLQRNTEYNRIIHRSAIPVDGKVTLTGVALWIPKLKPNVVTEQKILKSLESGLETSVAFREFKIYDNPIGTTTDVNWNVSSISSRPTRVFVAFQKTDKRTGVNSQQNNGGIFDNAGCTRIRVEVNGKSFPERDYQPDFTNNKYAREYMALLEAGQKCNASNCEMGSIVSYADYNKLYPIFCFDVSKRDSSAYQNDSVSRLDVRATLSGVDDRYAICLVESERVITFKGEGRTLRILNK